MAEIELRELAATPDDIALGGELVREYVVATAQEQADADGTEPDIERILPYIPDWRDEDFAQRYFPAGAFVVATVDREVAGCVGVTPFGATECEMNRLWVRPPFRSLGLGRTLAAAALDSAARRGFARMLLDVIPIRTRAIAVYESLGFVRVAPHHEYAFEVVAMAKELSPTAR
jgi:ribosomal protein S18 acetylase RimI-like enzyme